MTHSAGAPVENRRPTIVDTRSLRDTFREDVLDGLARPQKAIPPKHLYDARGSILFEQICELHAYYPTRTEAAILDGALGDIARAIGPGAVLIEPGSGSGEKAQRLLDAMDRPAAYVPVEISRAALEASADAIASSFPNLVVAPVCGDFSQGLDLPDLPAGRRVVFLPGSTIGNFELLARRDLLTAFAHIVGQSGLVILGMDLIKDAAILRAAYDDPEGVTAAFNLNLLTRINRELGGTFEIADFAHEAPWIEDLGRVEMRLVAQREHTVTVADKSFTFARGEWIHTENSCKFSPEGFDQEAAAAGLARAGSWTDEREWCRVGCYVVSCDAAPSPSVGGMEVRPAS